MMKTIFFFMAFIYSTMSFAGNYYEDIGLGSEFVATKDIYIDALTNQTDMGWEFHGTKCALNHDQSESVRRIPSGSKFIVSAYAEGLVLTMEGTSKVLTLSCDNYITGDNLIAEIGNDFAVTIKTIEFPR